MFAQQSKHRTRDAALIAAALVTGVAPSASGQTLADNATRFPTAVETGVSPVDCAVFRRYILQEAKEFRGPDERHVSHIRVALHKGRLRRARC